MIALYLVLALFLLFLLTSYICMLFAMRRGKAFDPRDPKVIAKSAWARHQEPVLAGIAWLALQETEQISLKSFDGLRLSARLFPAEENRGTILLFHGYRSMVCIDFSCAAQYYHELGFNLLLIDQHAVHERLLFDKLCKAYDQHAAGQELLVPLLVPMTRREQALLEENREILENMGLTVEPFGDGEVRVRSIPMVLGEPQAKGFLTELLDQLENERSLNTIEKRRASILQLACKKAVKGGDPLTETEIRDLVERMIDQQVTPTCPHGRPLVVALSHMELDKRFKRIQ